MFVATKMIHVAAPASDTKGAVSAGTNHVMFKQTALQVRHFSEYSKRAIEVNRSETPAS